MKLVFFLSFSLLHFLVFAQSGVSPYAQENLNAAGTASGIFQSIDNRELEIKGSPMLLSYYFPGYLIDLNSKTRKIDSINIDVYREEIVSKKDKNYIALDKGRIKSFGIVLGTNDTIRFALENYPKKGTVYEILLADKVSVYKKDVKTLVSQVKTGAYNTTSQAYSEYQQKTSYHLKTSEGKIVEIKSKKDVTGIFPALEDEIGAFFKRNKPSLKKDEGVISIGVFLNSF